MAPGARYESDLQGDEMRLHFRHHDARAFAIMAVLFQLFGGCQQYTTQTAEAATMCNSIDHHDERASGANSLPIHVVKPNSKLSTPYTRQIEEDGSLSDNHGAPISFDEFKEYCEKAIRDTDHGVAKIQLKPEGNVNEKSLTGLSQYINKNTKVFRALLGFVWVILAFRQRLNAGFCWRKSAFAAVRNLSR
jgi:hypothetical protein